MFSYMVPTPSSMTASYYQEDYDSGLGATGRPNDGTGEPASRSSHSLGAAVRQQDRFFADQERMQQEQAKDHQDLEAEFDRRVLQIMDQYHSNMQSICTDTHFIDSNGVILKTRKFEKKLQRRIRDLQYERLRNKKLLDKWYEKRETRFMKALRKEWRKCNDCSRYPFWGDELAADTKS